MPLFNEIPDKLIAAYAPVTGRLLTRYNRNIQAISIFNLQRLSFFSTEPGVAVTSSFANLNEKLRLFMPWDRFELKLRCFCSFQADPAEQTTVEFRTAFGAFASNVQSGVAPASGSDTFIANFTLNASGVTPDSYIEIEFQARETEGQGANVFMRIEQATVGGAFNSIKLDK